MQFLIIHGSYGSPDSNWAPQLKEKLESLGQKVIVPEFPTDNWDEVTQKGPTVPTQKQNLTNWLAKFDSVKKTLNPKDKLCIVAHSLGPVFALHLVQKYQLTLDCAIFVSPFLEKLNTVWQIDHANSTFYKTDFDFAKIKQLIPLSFVLYSDNDPYVNKKYPLDFAQKLSASVIPVNNAGHMNSEVNLNEFPLVLELCKSRLDLTLYQKYKAHRSELFDIDYNLDNSEEIIYLDPKEIRDEGIFHFRNLRKSGFCTCITGTEFWQTESKYMSEARKTAKRIHNFTRVFVVLETSDLNQPSLLERIKLDLDAEVNVFLVSLSNIKDQVTFPDFGIWDEEYRCVVRFNDQKQAQIAELSSRKQDINEALKWQKYILSKATKIIQYPQDIDHFIKTH